MIKKNTIINIIKELYLLKNINNKKLIFIDSKAKYIKIIKNNFQLKSISCIIIDFKKFKLSEVMNFFLTINNNINVDKNCIIFFDLNKELIAHNFFPDWPKKYKFINNLQSFYLWIKKFLFNFIYIKKIKFIAFKIK